MSEKKPTTRCMFCNSTAYGYGCAYSPHKRHVHIASGDKCIYCGSSAIGFGCPLNPFSKAHIRGVEYNNMIKESLHESVMTGLFLSRLVQPIKDMPAYKLGLIDETGRRIKEAVTEEEQASYTILDMHILKIRRLIHEDTIDLFKSSVLLEMASKSSPDKFNAEKYRKEVALCGHIDHAIDGLQETITEGMENGFSKNHIENLIIGSILKRYDNNKD
jgi:hypothetical protein